MKVVDLSQFRSRKELEVFAENLFKECVKMRHKIEDLQEKVEHLEDLLRTSLHLYKDDVE